MLIVKASAAAAILAASIAGTAGITYVATRMSVVVNCPATAAASSPVARPDLPAGPVLPLSQGKKW
jgi:CRISPR/Cas system-associated protein Csm6